MYCGLTQFPSSDCSKRSVKNGVLFERSEFAPFNGVQNKSRILRAILTFFDYFFTSRSKSNWGWGQRPYKSLLQIIYVKYQMADIHYLTNTFRASSFPFTVFTRTIYTPFGSMEDENDALFILKSVFPE